MAGRASVRVGVLALAAGAAVLGFPGLSGAATTIIVWPGQSIQAAVDAASPGDTILVEPGSYAEPGVSCPADPAQTCGVAIAKDGISLIGLAHGGRRAVLVNPGGQDVGIQVAKTGDPGCLSDPAETVLGSLVRGFTVSGFMDGLDVVCADNWRVTQVRAAGDAIYGIFPLLSGPGRVDHSLASGANDTGIYVGQSHNVRIDHNLATGDVAGFEIENSSAVRLDHNEATGNTAGISSFTLPFLAVTSNSGNRIDHNLVLDNNKANTCPPAMTCAASPGQRDRGGRRRQQPGRPQPGARQQLVRHPGGEPVQRPAPEPGPVRRARHRPQPRREPHRVQQGHRQRRRTQPAHRPAARSRPSVGRHRRRELLGI
jgi:parallel beta-helix repeat protein